MLTRRLFAGCAICAAAGFLAAGAEAQNATTPGIKRTPLKQTDGPTEGYVTIAMKAEVEPDALIARHTHPGVETGYILEGGAVVVIDGVGEVAVRPGEVYQVPTGVPHSGKNGPAKTVLVQTFVVEKGKPLASPA